MFLETKTIWKLFIVFLLFLTVQGLQLITKKQTVRRVSNHQDYLNYITNEFDGVLLWNDNQNLCGIHYDQIACCLETVTNFDQQLTIPIVNNQKQSLLSLIPNSFPGDLTDQIVTDISQLAESLKPIGGAELVCRMAIIDGVRCPKWHEDYVNVRLLKSYYGAGTEWIEPNNSAVNLLRKYFSAVDQDIVLPTNFVQHTGCGDVLLINGKKRGASVSGARPVLHRSPPNEVGSKRLLLSITIP